MVSLYAIPVSELTVVIPGNEDRAEIRATACVLDLYVHFSHGIDSIKLRSVETAVNAIKRQYPTSQVFEGARRLA